MLLANWFAAKVGFKSCPLFLAVLRATPLFSKLKRRGSFSFFR